MRKRIISALATLLLATAVAEELTFKQAVELALTHSAASGMAAAEQKKAEFGYQAQRGMFLPQLSIGSGLAYSDGMPLSIEGSAPTVLSVNSSQFLLNLAQRDFMKAAKTEAFAAQAVSADKRSQVILETALTYVELDKLEGTIKVLQQQEQAALKVEQVSKDRLQAGVDSENDVTRARLSLARVRLSMSNAQGNADVLRMRLAQLTGWKPDQIELVSESVPRLPEVPLETDFVSKALDYSPAVKAANEQATAKDFRASGERKVLLPSVDLAGQYGLLSKHNNYEDFFNRFQRHNVTVGLVIRFPFLNFSQRANAHVAEQEAIRSRKEAQAVRDEVATNTMKLQRSIRQLAAARDVAKLEYQLASSDSQAARARAEAGAATLRDQENARVVESSRYAAFLDAELELDKVQMQLLQVTGELEKWAISGR